MQPKRKVSGTFNIRTDQPEVPHCLGNLARPAPSVCPSVRGASCCESCASAEFRPTLWCTIPVVLLLDVLRIQFELRLPHASVEFSAASAAASAASAASASAAAAVGPGNA